MQRRDLEVREECYTPTGPVSVRLYGRAMAFSLTTGLDTVLLSHLRSVRLAIPARVVMGT